MGPSVAKTSLRWVIKFSVVHPLTSIALVVLVGISSLVIAGRVPAPFQAYAGSPNYAPSNVASIMPKGNLPAPASTEAFMKGQASYNADLVWGSLSSRLLATLAEQGAGKDSIQEQLDQYKVQGREMDAITYVGGYAPPGDRSFYFYVASIRRPDMAGQAEPVFFAFTLDVEGKILTVE